jgi:uncharacterized membrane protein SpoIIM required for sporulation
MLLRRCERLNIRRLPFDELRELGRLYRLHTSLLTRLRERDEDPEALRHINALCVRAYTLLYSSTKRDPKKRTPLLTQLASALGRTWRAQAFAWVLLLGGILIGGVLASREPESLYAFIPDSIGYSSEHLEQLLVSPEARARFLEGSHPSASWNIVFGSFLFVNNTRVGLLSFATGVLAGVPTILLQLYNGILIGAFASIFMRDPWPVSFLAWILPHGIVELTAITLCAAGGLLFGEAVAAPGRRSRQKALREAARPALLLFCSAIPLFALAALIESFVRESALSTAARLGIAGVLGLALILSLVGVRRLSKKAPVDTSWLGEFTPRIRSEFPDSGSTRRQSFPLASDRASAARAAAASQEPSPSPRGDH